MIIFARKSKETIFLIQRMNLNSGDFIFTKYNLNGFSNHKYNYILLKELTDSIYSNESALLWPYIDRGHPFDRFSLSDST